MNKQVHPILRRIDELDPAAVNRRFQTYWALQQGRPEDKNSIRPQIPSGRTWLWLVAVLAANYLMVRLLFPAPQGAITVPYTFFKEQVAERNVESIYSQSESITGRFKTAVTYPPPTEKKPVAKENSVTPVEKNSPPASQPPPAGARDAVLSKAKSMASIKFTTTLPTFVDPGLEKFLIDHDVEISDHAQSGMDRKRASELWSK